MQDVSQCTCTNGLTMGSELYHAQMGLPWVPSCIMHKWAYYGFQVVSVSMCTSLRIALYIYSTCQVLAMQYKMGLTSLESSNFECTCLGALL